MTLTDEAELHAFNALFITVDNALAPYIKTNIAGIVGAERALQSFLKILWRWTEVERGFCDGKSYADAVDTLRKSNKDNFEHVLETCRAHVLLHSTADIIIRIIDIIAEALRVQTSSVTNYLPGKKLSMVTGASSLSETTPILSEIGAMKGSNASAFVSLRARKLLIQESLPHVEERRSRIKLLCESKDLLSEETTTFIDENVPLADVFYPLMDTFVQDTEKVNLADLHLRKLYRGQVLKNFQKDVEKKVVKFTFTGKESERVFSATTPVSSMTDLTRAISRSTSMHKLGGEDQNADSDSALFTLSNADEIPSNTQRVAVCKLVEKVGDFDSGSAFESILASFPQFDSSQPKCEAGPVNVLYIVVLNDHDFVSDVEGAGAKKLENILTSITVQLKQADVRRVSFMFRGLDDDESDASYNLPSIFTYRAQFDFKEDTLLRNIDPSHAYRLDINRLAKNFNVKRIDSKQTATGNIHLYEANPRLDALSKDKAAKKDARVFVRALSFVMEFTATNFEKLLVDSLNALDVVHENGHARDNHLFMNLVSDYERIVLDPVVVENVVASILKRHGERITALGVTEVETKLVCCLTEDSPPIALRMVGSNPTGYVQVMNTYVEVVDASSTTPVFKLIGETKASLASSGDGSWEGLKVTSPYQLTRPFDVQRKSALRASDSLYCYDLPALFEAAVEEQWASSRKGSSCPHMVMFTSELVVQNKSNSSSKWTMDDYLNGDLELVQVQRSAGGNNVGMVAWLMTLKTVEYPQVRSFYDNNFSKKFVLSTFFGNTH
jgi:acetyl-CoA carboxylase/biotin carboxylase 1